MITREPEEAVVVVFDASGSMNLAYETIVKSDGTEEYVTRLMATQSFFKAFADRTMAYNFRHVVALVIFNNSIDLRCQFTESFLSFKWHIDKISPNFSTRLYDALHKAADMLAALEKDYPGVLKRIVCLSDGEDNDSTQTPIAIAKRLTDERILLDSFIVGDKSEVLKCLTFATGGSCFAPATI